jgi:hypothetical protein
LKVELAAVTFAPPFSVIGMRVLLDGTTELLPGEPQWSGEDVDVAKAYAANFYAFDVPPGVHTVRTQWRNLVGGNQTVFAHWRSMAVHHK